MIPGGVEAGVVLLLGALLFGADRIPRLARSVGESIGEFQKARQGTSGNDTDNDD